MVEEGNSSDAPSLTILGYFKYGQKLVCNYKLWGVADMPAI